MCPYCYNKENEINKFIYLSLYAQSGARKRKRAGCINLLDF